MAEIIVVTSGKGGVGKTTTCVSLAEAFAANGFRTLVVDLDTQANASLLVYGHEGDEHLFQAINDYVTISDWLLENFFAGEHKRLSEFIVTDASEVSSLLQRLEERYDREQNEEPSTPAELSPDIEEFLRGLNLDIDTPGQT